MAFGLKKFKKKSQEEVQKQELLKTKELVIRADPASFKLVDEKNLFEREDLIWLNDQSIHLEDYKFWSNSALNFYRDTSQLEDLDAFFYKNQSWNELGKRVKPLYELTRYEKYFACPELEWPLLQNLNQENLEKVSLIEQIEEIRAFEENVDLVDQYRWSVQLKSGQKVLCQNIHWHKSPKLLAQVFKEELNPQFLEFAHAFYDSNIFYAEFKLKDFDLAELEIAKKISFIPYSMTHSFNHCVFKAKKKKDFWSIGCFYLLNSDIEELNEEKILAHFRRILGRVYPDITDKIEIEKVISSEKIFFEYGLEEMTKAPLPLGIEAIATEGKESFNLFFSKSF